MKTPHKAHLGTLVFRGNEDLDPTKTDTDLDANVVTDLVPSMDTDPDPSADTDLDPPVDTDLDPSADTDLNPSADTDLDPSADTDLNPSADGLEYEVLGSVDEVVLGQQLVEELERQVHELVVIRQQHKVLTHEPGEERDVLMSWPFHMQKVGAARNAQRSNANVDLAYI